MKNNMNKVLAIALAVTLLALAVTVGTLAYLTDVTQQEVNTFTVGKVAITLDESKNEFTIVPDTTEIKDPEVTVVGGSEACWLFVKLDEATGAIALEAGDTFKDFVSYEMADDWIKLDSASTETSHVYYREVAKSGTDKPFTVLKDNEVAYPTTITSENLAPVAAGGAKPTLTITAYAVQKANSITNAAAAWDQVKDLTPDVVTP